MKITKEMYLKALDIVEQYLRQEIESIEVLKKTTSLQKDENIITFGQLDLSTRLINALVHGLFRCSYDEFISMNITELERYTYRDFISTRNVGHRSINELEEIMRFYNIKFKGKN